MIGVDRIAAIPHLQHLHKLVARMPIHKLIV